MHIIQIFSMLMLLIQITNKAPTGANYFRFQPGTEWKYLSLNDAGEISPLIVTSKTTKSSIKSRIGLFRR